MTQKNSAMRIRATGQAEQEKGQTSCRGSFTHPPFLTCPASMGMVAEAPASVLSIAYSLSDMVRKTMKSN